MKVNGLADTRNVHSDTRGLMKYAPLKFEQSNSQTKIICSTPRATHALPSNVANIDIDHSHTCHKISNGVDIATKPTQAPSYIKQNQAMIVDEHVIN